MNENKINKLPDPYRFIPFLFLEVGCLIYECSIGKMWLVVFVASCLVLVVARFVWELDRQQKVKGK